MRPASGILGVMSVAMLATLAVLALIDSTSFGTLVIPIWLLLHPGRVRPARVLVFLGTVASFYFVVGLAVAAGASALLPSLASLVQTPPVRWAQLALGVALFIWSFRIGRKPKPKPKPDPDSDAEPGPGRLVRWRARAMTGGSTAGLVGLALTAAVVEVGTMLPYLAAIGLITTADLPAVQVVAVMAGYCLVMVVPALALLALRLSAGHRLDPFLTRVSRWLSSSETLGWIVGIVGFLLARDAIVALGLLS